MTVSQKKKIEFWSNHLKAFTQSRYTQAEYCRKNNLKSSKFSYWKNRLRLIANNIKRPVKNKGNFVPVVQKRVTSRSDHILQLTFNGQVMIQFHEVPSAKWLSSLIKTLGVNHDQIEAV